MKYISTRLMIAATFLCGCGDETAIKDIDHKKPLVNSESNSNTSSNIPRVEIESINLDNYDELINSGKFNDDEYIDKVKAYLNDKSRNDSQVYKNYLLNALDFEKKSASHNHKLLINLFKDYIINFSEYSPKKGSIKSRSLITNFVNEIDIKDSLSFSFEIKDFDLNLDFSQIVAEKLAKEFGLLESLDLVNEHKNQYNSELMKRIYSEHFNILFKNDQLEILENALISDKRSLSDPYLLDYLAITYANSSPSRGIDLFSNLVSPTEGHEPIRTLSKVWIERDPKTSIEYINQMSPSGKQQQCLVEVLKYYLAHDSLESVMNVVAKISDPSISKEVSNLIVGAVVPKQK